jgi:hypothetical protein
MDKPICNLEERLLNYTVRVIRVTEKMPRSTAGRYVADQLLRSGSSPYGHHGEAEELIRIFTASIRTAQHNRPAT